MCFAFHGESIAALCQTAFLFRNVTFAATAYTHGSASLPPRWWKLPAFQLLGNLASREMFIARQSLVVGTCILLCGQEIAS